MGSSRVITIRGAKILADILTASRCFLAFVLFRLGLQRDKHTLPAAMTVLILAWITDLLDGALARRDPHPRHTLVGDHDLTVDVAVSLGALGYLVLSDYLPLVSGLTYVALASLLIWYYRSPALAMAAQAPPYGGMLWVGLHDAPLYGWLAVVWICLVVILTWPRFPREVLPNFLRSMRNLSAHRRRYL